MKNISDDELILMIRAGNEEAFNRLYKKYESFIKAWAMKSLKTQKSHLVELNDLLQIGRMEFWRILDKYREEEGIFYSFLKICIERVFYNYVKTFSHNKIDNYNELSLDAHINEDGETTFLEFYECETASRPDKIYELQEEIEKIYTSGIDEFEAKIISFRMAGFSYKEISEKLNLTRKQVDNHLMRIKNKIK